jgi:hypothetical protein
MKVFLAGIIQGSKVEAAIHSQDWRGPIIDALRTHLPEADIYCHFDAHPNSITYGPEQIQTTFDDGVQRSRDCDLLIAYVPSASMGTAIEMYEAYRSGATVLTISPMAANWVIRLYSHRIFPDTPSLATFLADGGLETLDRPD